LRKELDRASKNNNINKMKELSYRAKELATKLANESKDLFKLDEILGEDFHKMLLAIQNLIEYLNRNYLNDDILEKEVNTMTKTLYDPEVERKGMEKGMVKGAQGALASNTVKLLKKKLKVLPKDIEESILALDIEKLDQINDDIFDIEDVSQLNKYI